MARIVRRPITVTLQNDQPHTFVDRDYTHEVETVIDSWKEAGAWWEGESNPSMYTVRTTDAGMYDLEHVGEEWFIYRVWD